MKSLEQILHELIVQRWIRAINADPMLVKGNGFRNRPGFEAIEQLNEGCLQNDEISLSVETWKRAYSPTKATFPDTWN